MADFNAGEFLQVPDLTYKDISKLTKVKLICLCHYYHLDINPNARKTLILSMVVAKMTQEGALKDTNDEDTEGEEEEEQEVDSAQLHSKLSSVQLFELEKFKIEKQIENRRAEMTLRAEYDMKLRESEINLKAERERIEMEKRFALDRELAHREFDASRGEAQNRPTFGRGSSEFARNRFDVYGAQKCAPKFDEKNLEKYFLNFEKTAKMMKWHEDYWTLILQSQLTGKAADAYSSLSIDVSKDYQVVKATILRAYALLPEAYRQQFRKLRKNQRESYTDFSRELQETYFQWLRASKTKTIGDLNELILVEQFMESCPNDLRQYLLDKDVTTLDDCAVWSDTFDLNQKQFKQKPAQNSQNKTPFRKPSTDQLPVADSNLPTTKAPDNSKKKVVCAYCKGDGHVISECRKLKAKEAKREKEKEPGPTGLTVNVEKLPHVSIQIEMSDNCDSNELNSLTVNKIDEKNLNETITGVHPGIRHYMHLGEVSLKSDEKCTFPVNLLRDTGAATSLLKTGVFPENMLTLTDDRILLKGLFGDITSVPVVDIRVKCDLGTWAGPVGLIDELPNGVSFVLGNDLVHNIPSPVVGPEPLESPESVKLVCELPDVFPQCAVTRSMSRKEKAAEKANLPVDNSHDFNLADTFWISLDSDSDSEPIKITKRLLVEKQSDDPTLSHLFKQVVDEGSLDSIPVAFFLRDGVLMRKWRSPYENAEDCFSKFQIVLPQKYRVHVMDLAHSVPMAGHRGVTKTKDRIMEHFFWPKMRSDISEFCRTCHTCQMVGKPNQTIPKAPLKPIPALEQPFSRIIIDIVGPLPRTQRGNKYILTVMDLVTRFPEAYPIPDISAVTVAEQLVRFFSSYGFCKELQSDQGSNFMSELMQVLIHKLGIKQLKSTAYHPQSQGALERFHQTLKSIIKTFCVNYKDEWDSGLPLVLFACREVPVEGLGFSPFDLIYGHEIRGVMKLLKDTFLDEADEFISTNILDYWSDMKSKIATAVKLAQENLAEKQDRMKSWYDKNAVFRSFSPGEKVLLLIPMTGKPLSAKFSGPYKVKQKLNDLNYIVETPNRMRKERICHINMMKPYYERGSPVATVVPEPENTSDYEALSDSSEDLMEVHMNNLEYFENLDSLRPENLEDEKWEDFKAMLSDFPCVFSNVPSVTHLAVHDIDVGNSTPIKQQPYRTHPEKQKLIRAEITKLLESGILEKTNSPWSNPVLAIPKPDGSIRLVADMRKVNQCTVSDSYPIPRVDDLIDKVGCSKFLTKWDLRKGFWQVPLTERAKQICAIATPFGFYQFSVMVFGLKNAPASFQRLMNTVLEGLHEFAVCFIDDICVHSDDWQTHLEHNRIVLERLKQANLVVNLAKCEFTSSSIPYLGHVVGSGKVLPCDAKVRDMLLFPAPKNRKMVKQFLGAVGFYRKYIRNFSELALPLTELLKKNVRFHWSDKCESAFQHLKNVLSSQPVLAAPNFEVPFRLAVDSSDVGVGAVLSQIGESGIEKPISFFSKKLLSHQRKYSTVEKECLALVLALVHFHVYLSVGAVTVSTDHNPLVYISKMKGLNNRLLRWSLFLQNYDLRIQHIRGADNKLPDLLSRAYS